MDTAVEYEQFANGTGPAEGPALNGELDLGRIGEIPMELSVEIARTHMTMDEILGLHVGSVVTLERFAGEPVDLLVNGTPIARGKVVVVEEKFGLRVGSFVEDHTVASENGFAGHDEDAGPEPHEQSGAGELGQGAGELGQGAGGSPEGEQGAGGSPEGEQGAGAEAGAQAQALAA